MNRFTKILAVAVVALTSSLLHADSVTCPTNIGYNQPISNNMSQATGCELGSTNNDSVTQVNLDTMFNQNSWQQLGAANGTITGLGNTSGTSGSITLNLNWNTIGVLMIVLKDGNGQPPVYVGYTITHGFNGVINWTSPFANSQNGNPKDVSHINAYFIPSVPQAEVPEPASLLLLGSGLIGAGGFIRRKLHL